MLCNPSQVSRGALRTGTKCFQIACGDSHVIAALRSAGIVAWGRGAEGQLGLSPTPLQADDPDGVPTFLSSHVLHVRAPAFAIPMHGVALSPSPAHLRPLALSAPARPRLYAAA